LATSAQERLWIIDTSSIIESRRIVSRVAEKPILEGLTKQVNAGVLVFPKQVLAELELYYDPANPDPQFKWAKSNAATGSRKNNYDGVKLVLKRVPTVMDPEKQTPIDEADPYVIALALELREGHQNPTVITEDRKDQPKKMSLATACGLWEVPSVPLEAFLAHARIWTRPA
jgi:hypothetical protein